MNLIKYLVRFKTQLLRASAYLSIANTVLIFITFSQTDIGSNLLLRFGFFKYLIPFILYLLVAYIDYKFVISEEQTYVSSKNKILSSIKKDLDDIKKELEKK